MQRQTAEELHQDELSNDEESDSLDVLLKLTGLSNKLLWAAPVLAFWQGYIGYFPDLLSRPGFFNAIVSAIGAAICAAMVLLAQVYIAALDGSARKVTKIPIVLCLAPLTAPLFLCWIMYNQILEYNGNLATKLEEQISTLERQEQRVISTIAIQQQLIRESRKALDHFELDGFQVEEYENQLSDAIVRAAFEKEELNNLRKKISIVESKKNNLAAVS